MVKHALDRSYEVVGVCRERGVGKLEAFKDRIAIFPGATNDREVIKKAVAGCDAVLTVRQRSRRRREPGPAGLEQARGRCITRRVDFALFMVAAIENDALTREAAAIVGCQTPSARAFAAEGREFEKTA